MKEWQELKRKISVGLSLDDAATELGMTLDRAKELIEYAKDHVFAFDDDALRVIASKALSDGIRELQLIAQNPNEALKKIDVTAYESVHISDQGESHTPAAQLAGTVLMIQMRASGELVKFALSAMKHLVVKKAPAANPDLFDLTRDRGPWNDLKQPN